jgi:para-nitrobenzyl esterase
VFDTLITDQAVKLAGHDAPADLSRDMHRAWVSFIATGAPAGRRSTPSG